MSTFIPKISKISKAVIRILGCNSSPMTLQGTNTYVIGTGKKRILLDTGDPNVPEYINLLKQVLKENDCSLQQIVISHWHIDHIGGVPDILRDIKSDCIISKFPRPREKEINQETNDVELSYLKDGDLVEVEGATLRVVATPGHSDDHIVLVLQEENSLFSGDCILGEGTAVFEDYYCYMQSLNKILKLEPNRIYPGHGPVIENPKTKVIEYIYHRQQREQQILDELEKVKPNGLTPGELVKQIYISTPEHLHNAAEINVCHHLDKLCRENIVDKENSKKARFFLK